MKRVFWFLSAAILLAACAPAAPSTPEPPQTLPPPTATQVKLGPPPVQVGASYLYPDGATLIAVPNGLFIMGTPKGKDNPQHQVLLNSFWIYSTKVTNAQYQFCFNAGYCTAPDADDNPNFNDVSYGNQPVVGVTYDQAAAYCDFVHARLPTEAEWEKAARGPNGNLYPWGNDKPACDLLNFGTCVKKLTFVTKYPKGTSYYGAFDMAGNAFEWVSDWYAADYYMNSPASDPLGPEKGNQRSIRSSAYDTDGYLVDSARRASDDPSAHHSNLSFRCAVDDYNLTYYAPFCQMVSAVTEDAGVTSICPVLSITAQQSCKSRSTYVTFTDDHPGDPNASIGGVAGCTLISGSPGSFPQVYQCQTPSTTVMNSSCIFTGADSKAACAPHYVLNPSTGICDWDASATFGNQCLPAYNYDPARHCCSVVRGTGINYPACPAGTSFTEISPKHFACLPDSVPSTVTQQSMPIDPSKACTLQGVTACKLNSIICNQTFQSFCPTICSCLPTGFKCPTH